MNHSLFAIKKYKNNVADKYIFVQKEEIGNLNNNAYFCSRKYDGQLWFAIKEQDQISIVNASQRDITKQLGHITDQLSQKLKSVENIIVAGELYYQEEDKRERNGDISAALSGSLDIMNLKFGVFDILEHGVKMQHQTLGEKLEAMNNLFGTNSEVPVHAVDQQEIQASDVEKMFNKAVKEDAEGIVLRQDNFFYKIKEVEYFDLVVLGYTVNQDQQGLRSLSLGITLNDDRFLHIGSSGNFNASCNKKELYDLLKDQSIQCNYHQAASDGSTYIFVKPTVVVEIGALDMQLEKADEKKIRKMAFRLENNILQSIGKQNSVSLIGSSIMRIRDDKSVNKQECGPSQISKVKKIDKNYFDPPAQEELPTSKVVSRKIYLKESKKGSAIRKFIVWQTNKEESGVYPSFISYFLDFSESRKNPMAKKVKPFSAESKALAYQAQLIEENIKKGWEEKT